MTMSLVQQFLTDRAVLLTGCTGFLGKLVLSKLMESCSDLKCVYVLMRPGKSLSVQDRLLHMLQTKVFEKLKEHHPNFACKIIPIAGDMTEPNLGISLTDRDVLIDEVSVVYHVAQLSNCDCHLRAAIEVNVHGTKKLLNLSRAMKNLKSVIYVSSLYSNCNHPTIGEMIYQPTLHPQKLLNASEWVSDAVFCEIEAFLVKGHANAYTYTKALSEYMIQEEFSDVPISILRPAIIGSTWREPFPGWVDTNNGIVPLMLACGKGLLRVLKGNPKATAELIPADVVTNAIIACSWFQATQKEDALLIYNLNSNAGRRLTWGQLEQSVCSSFTKNPLNDVIRIPEATTTQHSVVFNVKSFLTHTLFSYVMDVLSVLLGRSPSYVSTNNQFLRMLKAAQYFTCSHWRIENENVRELMTKLSAADKKLFGFDTSCTHWPTYIDAFCMGIKQYVAKNELSDMNAARRAINRIRWVNRFWNAMLLLLCIRLASTRVEWARKLWALILAGSMNIYNRLPRVTKN